MRETQSLTQVQSLGLHLTPQQLRFTQLMSMNASELDEAVERELESNPALEAVDTVPAALPDSGKSAGGYMPLYGASSRGGDDDRQAFVVPDEDVTLYDMLERQLGELNLDDDLARVARYIVASLDGNGYLQRPLPLLVDDMVFNHAMDVDIELAEKALMVVQSLEPHGVGGRSLREVLSLQLGALPHSQVSQDASRIVDEQFDNFVANHPNRIVSALGLPAERVRDAVELLKGLNPKPGASVGHGVAESANVIVPDVILERNGDGSLMVTLNNRYPELVIQQSFAAAVAEMAREAAKRRGKDSGREFVTSNFNDAREFIQLLGQRQKTLVQIVTAIMKIQEEYFATENVYALRPMMLKDISAMTGIDMSVISRATSDKYLATPWGTFPLRFFFSDSKGAVDETRSESVDLQDCAAESGTSGRSENVLTNRQIEALIRRMVDEEDKRRPLSDEKLRVAMLAEGYDLSRRTIAKYRDRIHIPVARFRKSMG